MAQSQRVFDKSMLTKLCRCFYNYTKGADGAADLLEALSQSTQLEELNFAFCYEIPAAAWQKVPDGAWPKLRFANIPVPEEEQQRLCGRGELEGWTEGDPRRHDPSKGREEEDQRWSGRYSLYGCFMTRTCLCIFFIVSTFSPSRFDMSFGIFRVFSFWDEISWQRNFVLGVLVFRIYDVLSECWSSCCDWFYWSERYWSMLYQCSIA